jgi:stage II sporulation protein P
MARGAFFSVRGKKRWNRRNRTGRVFIMLMMSLLLLTGAVRHLSKAAVPVMAGTTGARNFFLLLPDRQAVLLNILGQVIPGFEQPAPTGNSYNDANGEGGTGLLAVSRFDPRDPKRILSAQIPYMGDVQPAVQPLLRQVNDVPENEDDQRKIIIPSRTVYGPGDGKVVIYHTHTTESFVPTSGKKFTEDLNLTVAKLGDELASILLETYGIPVVHNSQIHDIPRSTSYEKALPTVKSLLEENPDTKILIDLHRDGVDRKISTAQINGQNMGKILFVVGSSHPRWQENYQKALFLHNALEEMAPGISRGVRERPLVYNQHVHPGALLIEMGGHENSLVEAQRVLPLLARAIDLLYNN